MTTERRQPGREPRLASGDEQTNCCSIIARPETEGPLTLTIEQAARLLGLGRSAAYEAARCGQLPVVRFGRRLLVPRAALMRLLGVDQVPGQ